MNTDTTIQSDEDIKSGKIEKSKLWFDYLFGGECSVCDEKKSIDIIKNGTLPKLLGYLTSVGGLRKQPLCSFCNNLMQFKVQVKKNKRNLLYLWRCAKKTNKHKNIISVFKDSILENKHLNIRVFSFILFHLFIFDYPINKQIALIKDTGNMTTTKNSGLSINNYIKRSIKKYTLNECSSPIGPNADEVPIFEVYTDLIIREDNYSIWLICIYKANTKDIRIFAVMNQPNKCNDQGGCTEIIKVIPTTDTINSTIVSNTLSDEAKEILTTFNYIIRDSNYIVFKSNDGLLDDFDKVKYYARSFNIHSSNSRDNGEQESLFSYIQNLICFIFLRIKIRHFSFDDINRILISFF